MLDSHCHLADTQFDTDREEVIKRAKDAGIETMICIADSLDEAQKCREIANDHENIFATVGIHPHNAASYDETRDMPIIWQMAMDEKKCVAIGEIGLDYHYMNSPKESQEKAFLQQLLIAKQLDKPAVVHCREAVDDVWFIVNAVQPMKLVIHCCTEKWDDVQKFVDAGYYLSFTGIATYPKSDIVRDCIKHCPLEKMMIETDSPYLAPVPHRGKRNEPAFVAEVAKCIAAIKGLSLEEVSMQTTKNAKHFFLLP
ncbi:MAG: TatD family hydrolase [Candidatus Peribacteraceae bacterium]|nr:TatD family hydrolase [Candidatus Peribacteraceae bacterium]